MAKLARREAPGETSSSVLLPNNLEDGSLSQPRILSAISSGIGASSLRGDIPAKTSITWRQIVTVAVLCFVNLINYMDRFTIAGILLDIQKAFNVGDVGGGLLQTLFIVSYMIFAPVFGYLGDRYNRKWLMAFGVFLWGVTTLVGSFMESFYMFALCRAMVGIGEASYSTISPTIISDLFVGNMRSRMLAVFYFAIPVGSGLGYIIGSKAAALGGDWRWGLRVTPFLGAVAVFLILFVMKDPPRGESEGASNLQATSWRADIKALSSNKSFMLSTAGFTCVAFVAGALAWWGPTFIIKGIAAQAGSSGKAPENDEVAYIFGLITMISGLIGVPLGAGLAQYLRTKYPRADPLICAVGLLLSAPFLFAASLVAHTDTKVAFALIFFGELFLNLNWSIVADILLYVVIPTRRSSAEAFQILISHMFGDAGSPYLIGQVTSPGVLHISPSFLSLAQNVTQPISKDIEDTKDAEDPLVAFRRLQYALFICVFVEVLGGLLFVVCSWYVVRDKRKTDRIIAGLEGIAMSESPPPPYPGPSLQS
ncbi:unnamed protein product [Darwinula stevensoni]|uniref:Major facilitator superfamily (MFS) profile domain-containing protein n=1 Tax=Darwinula stevensoni TaxID=69355 RepID=A0A7R9FNQ0_9CRUS|nr:unnamed protein product [Darwinula stevensoni]CAG0896997.1 unnamed protein product [Darwinula stevensoni]